MNVSRYQNPPEQADYSALSYLNSKQDYLDVFVITLLHRSPIIYVLINITLLIWLAQTIISSKIQQIPRSAYLISPYLGLQPIKDISVTSAQNCPNEWEQVMLRTFPSIKKQSFSKKQMYRWGLDGNMTFCVKRINPDLNLIDSSGKCHDNFTSCSGYCFADRSQCPITSINAFKVDYTSVGKNRKSFYATSDGTRYIYSKQQGRPIVDLIATFHQRCSNDFHYNENYQNLTQYEKNLGDCGNQGTINGFYDKITEIKTESFMYFNNRPFKPVDFNLQEIELGSIHSIDFNNDIYGQCGQVKKKARQAKNFFSSQPVQPLFKQSLLVIGFILMIAQIIWLMIYVCINGYYQEKNIIVILICVIELTVITFIYSENSQVFETHGFIRSIANCIESEVVAASTWNFGLQSSSAFTMIQYVGTIFLAHYMFAYFMDKVIFETSSEQYKNFIYDDSQRSPGIQYSIVDRS